MPARLSGLTRLTLWNDMMHGLGGDGMRGCGEETVWLGVMEGVWGGGGAGGEDGGGDDLVMALEVLVGRNVWDRVLKNGGLVFVSMWFPVLKLAGRARVFGSVCWRTGWCISTTRPLLEIPVRNAFFPRSINVF